MLEQARRDVEQAPPEPKPSGPALQVPANVPGPMPLIVFLHGLGGSGGELSSGLHLMEFSQGLGFAFLAPDGTLSKDIMPDLLHPNAAGYKIWQREMQPELDKLMR